MSKKRKNKKHSGQHPHSNGQGNTLTVTLDGWMAHQILKKQYVWVCDNKGKIMGEFLVKEKLTAEQLKSYITYCKNHPIAEDSKCQ